MSFHELLAEALLSDPWIKCLPLLEPKHLVAAQYSYHMCDESLNPRQGPRDLLGLALHAYSTLF